MTHIEKTLLMVLVALKGNTNSQAVMLQSFITEFGPLSEEAATEVRNILGGKDAKA